MRENITSWLLLDSLIFSSKIYCLWAASSIYGHIINALLRFFLISYLGEFYRCRMSASQIYNARLSLTQLFMGLVMTFSHYLKKGA